MKIIVYTLFFCIKSICATELAIHSLGVDNFKRLPSEISSIIISLCVNAIFEDPKNNELSASKKKIIYNAQNIVNIRNQLLNLSSVSQYFLSLTNAQLLKLESFPKVCFDDNLFDYKNVINKEMNLAHINFEAPDEYTIDCYFSCKVNEKTSTKPDIDCLSTTWKIDINFNKTSKIYTFLSTCLNINNTTHTYTFSKINTYGSVRSYDFDNIPKLVNQISIEPDKKKHFNIACKIFTIPLLAKDVSSASILVALLEPIFTFYKSGLNQSYTSDTEFNSFLFLNKKQKITISVPDPLEKLSLYLIFKSIEKVPTLKIDNRFLFNILSKKVDTLYEKIILFKKIKPPNITEPKSQDNKIQTALPSESDESDTEIAQQDKTSYNDDLNEFYAHILSAIEEIIYTSNLIENCLEQTNNRINEEPALRKQMLNLKSYVRLIQSTFSELLKKSFFHADIPEDTGDQHLVTQWLIQKTCDALNRLYKKNPLEGMALQDIEKEILDIFTLTKVVIHILKNNNHANTLAFYRIAIYMQRRMYLNILNNCTCNETQIKEVQEARDSLNFILNYNVFLPPNLDLNNTLTKDQYESLNITEQACKDAFDTILKHEKEFESDRKQVLENSFPPEPPRQTPLLKRIYFLLLNLPTQINMITQFLHDLVFFCHNAGFTRLNFYLAGLVSLFP